jgi:hypothetical protein
MARSSADRMPRESPRLRASGQVMWHVCGTLYEIEHTTRMLCSGLRLVTWTVRAARHNPLSSPTLGLCPVIPRP